MGELSRGDECLDVFILIKLTLLPEALVLTIFGCSNFIEIIN